MTLQVPFEQFVATAKRVVGAKEAYISRHPKGSLVTASSESARMVVASVTVASVDAARGKLREAGMHVYDGGWSTEGLIEETVAPPPEIYVAAVAYESGEGRPGIWLDAFPELPTQVQVLRAMYREFLDTGELTDIPFEEFVRLANTNVVVVPPSQLAGFAAAKGANGAAAVPESGPTPVLAAKIEPE